MTFDTIREQAALLVPDERRQLVAFLISLEDAQNETYRAKLREKIDERTPGRWLTLEQLAEGS